MKILISYFSGTGNTKKVLSRYSEEFEKHGNEVTMHKIEDGEVEDLSQFDLFVIGYPIHAFNAPAIILDYAKKLPKQAEQKRLVIIKTSGEPLRLNNISSLKLKSILKKRNIVLTNEYHYVMPYNMIFRHTDAMAYRMWTTADALIPVDCQEILDGTPRKLPGVFMGRFLAWIFRIEFWGGRFNGKKYKVNDKCIKCGMCARNCPVGNITIDENGNFKFGKKCIMCMRCSFHCPTDAFKIGWFNGWKVNGAYSFKKPDHEEVDKHKRYCRKSYKKYFARAEAKIAAANSVPEQTATKSDEK